METAKLKSDIHEIVDRIESEELLISLYDFLKLREKSTQGELWRSLNDKQKREVFLAWDESEDEQNLISRKEFLRDR